MSKTVLFFPGQASQYVGMAKDLYEFSPAVRDLYQLAADELGADIARLSFEGPSEELKRTRFTQPAILLHSLSVLRLLGQDSPAADYAAGHSLGEYGALAVAGAFTFEDAVRAVVRRATLMEEACIQKPGTMAATMGLTPEQVQEVCEKAADAGIVVPANFNSTGQIVISGEIPAVEKACELAKAAGAKRAIRLEVGGAFHSPLMASARDGLEAFLRGVEIKNPAISVVANVTGEPVVSAEEVRRLLVEQITSPVRWTQTMLFLVQQDVKRIIEIGPGKVLTGLAKREMRPDESISLDTLIDVRQFAPVEA